MGTLCRFDTKITRFCFVESYRLSKQKLPSTAKLDFKPVSRHTGSNMGVEYDWMRKDGRVKDRAVWPVHRVHASNRSVFRLYFSRSGPVLDMLWLAGGCFDPACIPHEGEPAMPGLQWQTPLPNRYKLANKHLNKSIVTKLFETPGVEEAKFEQRCTDYYNRLRALP